MIHIPVIRWGEPYESMDVDKVVHFDTGEILAEVSQANAGLVGRDMKFAQRDTYLISPDGKIAKVWTGVNPNTHSEEVLAEIESQKKMKM